MDAKTLYARENVMQITANEIFAVCQKTEIPLNDLMIVFGGILNKQAAEAAKATGRPLDEINKELLQQFAQGFSGIHLVTSPGH